MPKGRLGRSDNLLLILENIRFYTAKTQTGPGRPVLLLTPASPGSRMLFGMRVRELRCPQIWLTSLLATRCGANIHIVVMTGRPPNAAASEREAMEGFWKIAGLEATETKVIRIATVYSDFDDF